MLLSCKLLVAQTTFEYTLIRQDNRVDVYFGEESELISHIIIHAAIGAWNPKYSLIAAISIETADTINGRFDVNDWGARLVGCLVGFFINKHLFKKGELKKWK